MRRVTAAALLLLALAAVPLPARQPPPGPPLPRPDSGVFVPERPAARPGARPEEPLVKQVQTAIERGVRYLRQHQQVRGDGVGDWENESVVLLRSGGVSALTLLALLNAGVKPDDPLIQRGLAFLRKIPPSDTYVVGLQTMVFAEIGDPRDGDRIQRNVNWLKEARVMSGGQLQGWTYGMMSGSPDNSNSQYALLGLYAGQQAGAKIDPEVWNSIRQFYTRTQRDDGGWSYQRADAYNTILTMTVAGLCGLIIAGMEQDSGRHQLRPDGSAENCGVYKENEPIARALTWIGGLDAANQPHFRFNTRFHVFYNVYGIERAGRLTGQRFLAGHDWYREGCEFLVGLQQDDGSWALTGGMSDSWPAVSTSFALLFLSKGRTPILVSKYAHDPGEDWNNKHHDARHLAEYASKTLFKKQPLAWQVYDSRNRSFANRAEQLEEVGALLQSPIVYMNGHQAPRLSAAQKQVLKQYLEEGGFLMAEACCGRKEFADGFRKLMKELFPGNDLRPLPAEHPIWKAHAVVPPDFVALEGIEQGCKTVVVFSPQPLAGYWEENLTDDRGRGTLAFRLAGNIIAYATGLEMPKPRLTQTKVADPKAERRVPRGFLKVVQVKHEGDWQPAPRAMRKLMEHVNAAQKLDVALEPETFQFNNPNLYQYKFLYVHGRGKFEASADDLENLRAALETGSLLFADACCGSATFDAAFRSFAAKLYPDAKLETIPVTDELYGRELNGAPITSVRVRKDAAGGFVESAPYLEGIRKDGRWVVIYSKYDVGCALENHQSSDCKGHDNASALRLGTAAVLYALKK